MEATLPRARRKKQPETPATEPAPLAAVLEPMAVRLHLPEPITQPQLAAPAVPEISIEAPAMALDERPRIEPAEPERTMPEPEAMGPHSAAVLASRPRMQPAPTGFRPGPVFVPAGIRVNRGVERWNYGTAAIQFASDRKLSRATEYGLMERIQEAGFQFQPNTRQWERETSDGMSPGENFLGAVKLAEEIAAARGQGRDL